MFNVGTTMKYSKKIVRKSLDDMDSLALASKEFFLIKETALGPTKKFILYLQSIKCCKMSINKQKLKIFEIYGPLFLILSFLIISLVMV